MACRRLFGAAPLRSPSSSRGLPAPPVPAFIEGAPANRTDARPRAGAGSEFPDGRAPSEQQARITMNITWKQADHDVYVATRDGEYAGFVSVESASHVLHDRHSRRLGSYPSLSAARSALDSFDAPARPALDPSGTPAAAAAARRPRRSARSRRRPSPARSH